MQGVHSKIAVVHKFLAIAIFGIHCEFLPGSISIEITSPLASVVCHGFSWLVVHYRSVQSSSCVFYFKIFVVKEAEPV